MKCFIIIFTLALLWREAVSERCTTPSGRTSQCVALQDCPHFVAAMLQKPLRMEVAIFLRKSRCGFDKNIPRVCCGPLPQPSNVNTTPKPKTIPRSQDPVNPADSYLSPRNQCGSDDNGDRIFGGQVMDLDEFPWMAVLGYKPANSDTMIYQCGGALINARYILSAAHCAVGEIETIIGKLTTARLGEYDLRTDVDCLNRVCADPVQEIRVQSVFAHSGYSDTNLNRRDDLSVIRLAKRVTFSDYVQPICLSDTRQQVSYGDKVFVAGWGMISDDETSSKKLKLELPIFSKSQCVRKYRRFGAELTDKQICAGGTAGEDTCAGDSGGPLMRRSSSSGPWEAVGVVSFGNGCGKNGWPGVYTKVPDYLDWIKETMRKSNI